MIEIISVEPMRQADWRAISLSLDQIALTADGVEVPGTEVVLLVTYHLGLPGTGNCYELFWPRGGSLRLWPMGMLRRARIFQVSEQDSKEDKEHMRELKDAIAKNSSMIEVKDIIVVRRDPRHYGDGGLVMVTTRSVEEPGVEAMLLVKYTHEVSISFGSWVRTRTDYLLLRANGRIDFMDSIGASLDGVWILDRCLPIPEMEKELREKITEYLSKEPPV